MPIEAVSDRLALAVKVAGAEMVGPLSVGAAVIFTVMSPEPTADVLVSVALTLKAKVPTAG